MVGQGKVYGRRQVREKWWDAHYAHYAHYARANLVKVVGRVPGALGTLLDAVRHFGLEDAGKLGAVIAKVASLLEEGDLPGLEDTILEISLRQVIVVFCPLLGSSIVSFRTLWVHLPYADHCHHNIAPSSGETQKALCC